MKWYVSYRSGPIDPYSSSPKMAILYNSISTNIIDFFVISKYTALGLLLESQGKPRKLRIIKHLRGFLYQISET